jgi:hypothetical protein
MYLTRCSFAALVAMCLTHVAVAQEPMTRTDASSVLGLSLTFSGTARDTLGAVVESVVAGGPADHAGIFEGSRVSDVAGVSLRVDPADVGEHGVVEQMSRRLARALRSVQPGAVVALHVVSGTRQRSVEIQTDEPHVAAEVLATAHSSPPGPGIGAPVAAAAPLGVDALAPTLASVTNAIEAQRILLRRLARAEEADVKADSLVRIDQDLRAVIRRLHDVLSAGEKQHDQDAQQRAEPVPPVDSSNASLPGLSIAPVAVGMEYYFGAGSEGGVIIITADSSWAPLRSGDVLLRIDGRNVDTSALRAALGSGEPVAIEILRERRRMLLTLHGAE